jgi:flagellar biosynthesis/type III secretory pathway protein FliH
MTLSSSESESAAESATKSKPNADSSVSWRLNELISAGRKAKAFASAQWSQSENVESESEFKLWTPTVLPGDTDPEVVDESVDEDAAIAEQAEVAEEDAAAVAEEIEPPPPSFDQLALDQARSESFDQGYQQAMIEAEGKWASARDEFMAFTETLRSAQTADSDFYLPLKKLALHLAEQLVRGELTQSTAVIERLLEEAIKDIEQQGEGPIVVVLSAADHAQFTAHLSSDTDHLSLRIDPNLSRGSVRITMDDSAVEDLIETRLSALSEKLLGLPEHQSAPKSTAKQPQTVGPSDADEALDGTIIEDLAADLVAESGAAPLADSTDKPSTESNPDIDDENPDA